MLEWRRDIDAAPRDGRWVFILDDYGTPAAVYWSEGFGWTFDGGDRYTPTHWAECKSPTGEFIYGGGGCGSGG